MNDESGNDANDEQLDQGRTEEETNLLIDEANEGSSQVSDYLEWEMPAEINQTEYDDLASIMASTLSEEGNSERMSEKCYEALILNFMLRHKANMVMAISGRPYFPGFDEKFGRDH